jgi:hypothetical protein
MTEGPITRGAPIERVQPGMTVVDRAGRELGKVEDLKMGDPGAETTQGNERSPQPVPSLGWLLGEREPDVPEPFYSELLRVGYIKVDGPGFVADDRYVPADRIVGVDGDTVTVDAGAAIPEQ